jgi:putative FmdB family regulatory protein
MPIYEYMCEDCDVRFERFVRSMSATTDVSCPQCGGTHTKKAFSLFGLGKSNGDFGGVSSTSAACSPAGT